MDDRTGAGAPRGTALTAAAILGFALIGAWKGAGGPQSAVATRDARAPDAAARPQAAPSSSRPGVEATPTRHHAGVVGIAKAVFDRFNRDNISLVAAGVAFYVLLSIFPALAALVSVYGLVGNPDDVAARISDYGYLLPPEALKLITDGLHNFAKTAGTTLSWTLATSVVLALWSARAGVSSVMTGLNIAYEESEERSFIMQTLIALGLTLGAVLFAVVVIAVLAVVPIVLKVIDVDGLFTLIFNIARWPVLAILVAIGFAVIYRYGPSRRDPHWRWISWGSVIATVLWLVGSALFTLYVSKFGSYDATYGALGAVVVLLLWFWVSAIVLLVGAEIDAELDQRATTTGSPLAPVAPGTAKKP